MERSWVICDSFHLSSVWVHSLRDTPVTGDSQSFSPGHPAPHRPAFARVAPERYPEHTACLHTCCQRARTRVHRTQRSHLPFPQRPPRGPSPAVPRGLGVTPSTSQLPEHHRHAPDGSRRRSCSVPEPQSVLGVAPGTCLSG